MADEQPTKKPVGASATQALDSHQVQSLEEFQNAMTRVKKQLDVQTDDDLCAWIDKHYRSTDN